MFRRGKRLFLGVADPTDLHAIDEIKFQTGLGVDAVIVEDDKLQKAVDKAIEGAEAQMPSLGGDDEGMDLEGLEVSGGEELPADGGARDDVEDAPIVRFVNKLMLDAIRRAPRTSTSNPTRRPIACASAPTACSRKWPSRRCSWPASSRRASR